LNLRGAVLKATIGEQGDQAAKAKDA
jgi:hypothetical protein